MEFMAEAILSRWFVPTFKEKSRSLSRVLQHAHPHARGGYTGTCEAIRDADLTEAAKTIGAPTLILCGTEDVSLHPP